MINNSYQLIQINNLNDKMNLNYKFLFILLVFTIFFFPKNCHTIQKKNIPFSINYTRNISNNKNNYKINNKTIIYIDIDNKYPFFEKDINFSNYSTDIKVIAFYSLKYCLNLEKDLLYEQNHNEWLFVKNAKSLLEAHNQPRIPLNDSDYLGYYNLCEPNIILKQIKLAKNHGIYGFAIYYYWFQGKIMFEKPLNIYIRNKEIDFPFFLIWKNLNCSKLNYTKNNFKCKKDNHDKFIKDIKKYIIDNRYIRINEKPIIGINDPLQIENLIETIKIWREKAKEYGIGEIYIIMNLNDYNINNIKKMKLFDAVYDCPPKKKLIYHKIKYSISYIYTDLIYQNMNFMKVTDDFPIFRGNMLEFDNSPKIGKNPIIFEEFSPEKFYFLNKMIIEWTRSKYNISNRFIFVNSWNEWSKGSYLEPDTKYGYSNINALSKTLFNISYRENNYNLLNLKNSSYIAIHAHVFYEKLINEVINKTNNIPVKFDLYLTTTSLNKYKIIEKYIKKYSIANKHEIKIVENKGRDVLPLLIQLKNIVKKYKYFCHIHTKISKQNPKYGEGWRYYLYNNLLGSKEYISEILSIFENKERIGFIFPETFYKLLFFIGKRRKEQNKLNINFLLKNIFPNNNYEVGNILDFPAGNMFWARVSAVHQIFEINIIDKFPKETGQLDCTIMHGIERIWLYIVKLNDFFYLKIFKHY